MSFDLNNALAGMMGGVTQMQEEAGDARVEGRAGGNLVVATCNGRFELVDLCIAGGAMSDRELLEDLVKAAVSDAQRAAREMMAEKMKSLTGGLPIPPGLF